MGNIRGLDKNKRISTLNSLIKPSLTLYRANGNTTRQVDYAIQLLFDGHIVEVRDHWEFGENEKANKWLFDRIMKRLSAEHGYILARNKVNIDLHNLAISIDE